MRACVCTDILCLEDYAKMEQEQLKREMKGSKRSCLSDMHQQLACGKKKHQQKTKETVEAMHQKPSQCPQNVNRAKGTYF